MLGIHHITKEPLENRLSSVLSGQLSDRRLTQILSRVHSNAAAPTPTHSKNIFSLMRTSMYAVDTGFANEEVPLNEERYYLPFYQRLVIRSIYVMLITAVAAVLPFFTAFVGLVGALTWFPLSVHFPFACYRRVTTVGPKISALMWATWGLLLIVSVAATLGSIRTIINDAETFSVFGTGE